MKQPKFGHPPEACDICETPFGRFAYDAATSHGPWAWMCRHCFEQIGRGLGTGVGQEYTKQGEDWVKTRG